MFCSNGQNDITPLHMHGYECFEAGPDAADVRVGFVPACSISAYASHKLSGSPPSLRHPAFSCVSAASAYQPPDEASESRLPARDARGLMLMLYAAALGRRPNRSSKWQSISWWRRLVSVSGRSLGWQVLPSLARATPGMSAAATRAGASCAFFRTDLFFLSGLSGVAVAFAVGASAPGVSCVCRRGGVAGDVLAVVLRLRPVDDGGDGGGDGRARGRETERLRPRKVRFRTSVWCVLCFVDTMPPMSSSVEHRDAGVGAVVTNVPGSLVSVGEPNELFLRDRNLPKWPSMAMSSLVRGEQRPRRGSPTKHHGKETCNA